MNPDQPTTDDQDLAIEQIECELAERKLDATKLREPTGEWTVEQVQNMALEHGSRYAERIAAHHNAAIAAERDYWKPVMRVSERNALLVDQLREQLDAEREERAIIERSREAWKNQVAGLTAQLAAARQPLVDALKEIRDAGYTLTRQDGTNVIDATLEKVKEKP